MTDEEIKALVDLFLAWPLPESVCADLCATKQGPGRSGTNLLSADEARQMFTYLFAGAHKNGRVVINMRAKPEDVALFDAAAGVLGVTRTRLMLDSACQEAIRVLRERGPVIASQAPPGPPSPPRPPKPREYA